jgi:hypothetical protein
MPKSTHLLQRLSFQNLLGKQSFADTLEQTIGNKIAETQFKIFLITVQKFDQNYLDSLLAVRFISVIIIKIYEDDYEDDINTKDPKQSHPTIFNQDIDTLQSTLPKISTHLQKLKSNKSPLYNNISKKSDLFSRHLDHFHPNDLPKFETKRNNLLDKYIGPSVDPSNHAITSSSPSSHLDNSNHNSNNNSNNNNNQNLMSKSILSKASTFFSRSSTKK